jgi:poly(beta-D-mannuronate) lyase
MRPIIALCLAVSISSHAAELLVTDVTTFDAAVAKAQPGDEIVLQDGEWKDARLKLRASGTVDVPVTIRAQTPGKVVLTGDSRLSIGAHFVLVRGLHFQNPTGEESIELRIDSDEVASDCRVTDCAVTNTLPAGDKSKTARFISLYGAEHRVDHCRLEGKTTAGPAMVVWLSKEQTGHGRHRIDHNYFGPRERLGKNGGETIRLGDSETSMQNAQCVVEHNVFEKCNGEAECISNKSCGNVYRRNTFLAVSGTLTLRHGNTCRVEQNAFLGAHEKGCGGIRIIGEDHTVSGNYLEALDGNKERSAICLMAGIPDSPANGYFQVKNARLEKNIVMDCKSPLMFGYTGSDDATLPPLDTIAVGNYFSNVKPKVFPDHPGLIWEKKYIQKPTWVDAREAAGTTWK